MISSDETHLSSQSDMSLQHDGTCSVMAHLTVDRASAMLFMYLSASFLRPTLRSVDTSSLHLFLTASDVSMYARSLGFLQL